MHRMSNLPEELENKSIDISLMGSSPGGEELNVSKSTPIIQIIVDREMVAQDYLKLVDFFGRNTGLLPPDKYLALVSRDQPDDEEDDL